MVFVTVYLTNMQRLKIEHDNRTISRIMRCTSTTALSLARKRILYGQILNKTHIILHCIRISYKCHDNIKSSGVK